MALGLIAAPGRSAGGIRVIADGRERLIERSSGTVAEVLSLANVNLHERDLVTPAAGASVRSGDVIRVVRVDEREVTVEEKTPAPTVVRPPATGRGPYHPTVTTGGKPGLSRRTYRVVLRDGVEVQKTLLHEELVRAPVPAVVTARPGISLGTRGVYAGRRVFVMVATAYDPGPGSCGKYADGITCDGKRAGYGIAAVDPTIIPLGSKLYIEGYGYAIAADVGGAIKGYRIDLGYNSRGGAFQWGRRTVRVIVLD